MHKNLIAPLALALMMVAAPAVTMNKKDSDPQVFLSSEDAAAFLEESSAGLVEQEAPSVLSEDDCFVYYSNGHIEYKEECKEEEHEERDEHEPEFEHEFEPEFEEEHEWEDHREPEDHEMHPPVPGEPFHGEPMNGEPMHEEPMHEDPMHEPKHEFEPMHEEEHEFIPMDFVPEEFVPFDEKEAMHEPGQGPQPGPHHGFEAYDLDFEDDFEAHAMQQVEEILRMTDQLERRIQELHQFISDMEEEHGDKENIQDMLKGVEKVAEKAEKRLEKMRKIAESGELDSNPEAIHKFWEAMDQINRAADKHIRAIMQELGERPMIHFAPEHNRDNAQEMFHDKYGEKHEFEVFEEHIDFEAMEHIVREVPEGMMEQVAQHMHNPHAGEMMAHIMNNMDVLDDKAKEMMEYSIELMNVMEDIEIEDDEDPRYDKLKMLFDRSMTVLSEDTHDDIIAFWVNVKSVVEAGATDAQLTEFAEEMEVLLTANEEALVEEGVQFKDVRLADEDWFFDPVIKLKNRGIVNGKGGGNYDPGAAVTNAEILKILLESAEIGASEEIPMDPAVQDAWYAGYVAQAQSMGLDTNKDWNAAASRGDVAVWASQIFELDHQDADIPFADIDANDPNLPHYQAVYQNEIFSGAGDTGNLNPDANINRAESAKVALMIIENIVELQDLDELEF